MKIVKKIFTILTFCGIITTMKDGDYMDYLLKALVLNNEARAYIVSNTNTVNTAIEKHNLWPGATSVLGKTLTMGQLMGSMLKGDAALTIKINGMNGQLGNIIVDANSKGDVRGYVDNPHVSIVNNKGGMNDLYAIGTDGMIDVIKDLKLKELFTSSIECSGNLANDFTYYFYESEQTRSVVSLAMLIDVDNTCTISGGLIIQLLPNASEETIVYLENIIAKYPSLNDLLAKYSLEEIIDLLFKDNYEILEKNEVCFKCPCTKETFSKALITLGKDELTTILNEDHKIEAVCHYCGDKYTFDEQELKQLIKEI